MKKIKSSRKAIKSSILEITEKDIENAINTVKKSPSSTWYKKLHSFDDGTSLYFAAGTGEGYDDDELHVCGKIAVMPDNSTMSEYDYDFIMPYDPKTGEVYDTDTELSSGDSKYFNDSAKEVAEMVENGELVTSSCKIQLRKAIKSAKTSLPMYNVYLSAWEEGWKSAAHGTNSSRQIKSERIVCLNPETGKRFTGDFDGNDIEITHVPTNNSDVEVGDVYSWSEILNMGYMDDREHAMRETYKYNNSHRPVKSARYVATDPETGKREIYKYNNSHKPNKIIQSKERLIMNGAIKELEELFSTKAKGNTVYFNDVCYTPLPLPVQNAVKLIMDEYPDLRYRMGLYSVTVFDKNNPIKSSRKAIKSSISSRDQSALIGILHAEEETGLQSRDNDFRIIYVNHMPKLVDMDDNVITMGYNNILDYLKDSSENFSIVSTEYLESSRRAIKSSNCETMNRREVDSIVWDYIKDSNIVGKPAEVEFVDGSFGTVTWLDSDGDEIEVCGYEHGKPVHSSRRIQSRNISSSGAFRDRDEDDHPECIIEILEDGKWEGVGIDKNADDGWSTNVNFTVFESEDKARKSGMARRLKNAGYSEEDGTLKFSTK